MNLTTYWLKFFLTILLLTDPFTVPIALLASIPHTLIPTPVVYAVFISGSGLTLTLGCLMLGCLFLDGLDMILLVLQLGLGEFLGSPVTYKALEEWMSLLSLQNELVEKNQIR